MLLLPNQSFVKSLQVISFKNDAARVNVPSFQNVTFDYNMKYSTETISIYVFVCLKMLLTAVIY